MTITSVMGVIKTTIQAMPSPPLRVTLSMREAVNVADFPLVLITLPDQLQMSYGTDTHGWRRSSYTVQVWWFVGALGLTPYEELKDRAVAVIEPLGAVLNSDSIKVLSSAAFTGGNEVDSFMMQYRLGSFPWGAESEYYGVSFNVPILEVTNWR
jgi:hypothetical protein